MKITIDFNTDSKNDLLAAAMFGANLVDTAKAITSLIDNEEAASRDESEKSDETTDVPQEENASESAPETEKEDVEQPTQAEEPQPTDDLPFPVDEPVAPQSEEKPALVRQPIPQTNEDTCTTEQWRKALAEKKNELQLNAGQANHDKLPYFNDFIHRLSEDFGDRIPSHLSDTQRGEFIKFFNTIYIKEDGGFNTNYLPF